MPRGTEKSRIFYGWYVVMACFSVTMSLGQAMWSFGIFFKPLQAEFGWTRSMVSSGYTAFLITYSLSILLAGKLFDRHGPRLVLLVSGILTCLGICLCSQMTSLNELRFFLMIAGLGAGGTWTVPIATVQQWFYRKPKAGLALGIVTSGVGIGAIVFIPLINYLILSHGWRNAFLIVGILCLVVIVSAALFVRESRAIEYGNSGLTTTKAGTPEMTMDKVLTHSSFLIITFVGCATASASQFVSVHLVPFATDLGISAPIAAAAVGLIGAVSIVGRILSGLLADKIGWRRTLCLSIFGLTLAVIWTLFTRSGWMIYFFAVFFGLSWGVRVTAVPGILGSFFGMHSVGNLIGITSAIGNISSAFVPYIAGYMFDSLGSYTMVFLSLALLLLVAGMLTTMLKKP